MYDVNELCVMVVLLHIYLTDVNALSLKDIRSSDDMHICILSNICLIFMYNANELCVMVVFLHIYLTDVNVLSLKLRSSIPRGNVSPYHWSKVRLDRLSCHGTRS